MSTRESRFLCERDHVPTGAPSATLSSFLFNAFHAAFADCAFLYPRRWESLSYSICVVNRKRSAGAKSCGGRGSWKGRYLEGQTRAVDGVDDELEVAGGDGVAVAFGCAHCGRWQGERVAVVLV